MNAKDFTNDYIMHDSLINDIQYLDTEQQLNLWIDFAFWMQKGYRDSDPETGIIKVTFNGVSKFVVPDNLDLEQISIIEITSKDTEVTFAILNDMTDDYLEIVVAAEDITVDTNPEIA